MSHATAPAPLPAEEPADLDHAEAWEQEIDRRMEEVRMGQVETIPAEQVFAEIDVMLEQRALARRTGGKRRR